MIGASHPPILEVDGLRKQFGEHVVLASVDLAVSRGSIVSVFGRSGTGKSVFLKCVAGLLTPDAGKIRFENDRWMVFASAAATCFRAMPSLTRSLRSRTSLCPWNNPPA